VFKKIFSMLYLAMSPNMQKKIMRHCQAWKKLCVFTMSAGGNCAEHGSKPCVHHVRGAPNMEVNLVPCSREEPLLISSNTLNKINIRKGISCAYSPNTQNEVNLRIDVHCPYLPNMNNEVNL
jgi:hypothetical protein